MEPNNDLVWFLHVPLQIYLVSVIFQRIAKTPESSLHGGVCMLHFLLCLPRPSGFTTTSLGWGTVLCSQPASGVWPIHGDVILLVPESSLESNLGTRDTGRLLCMDLPRFPVARSASLSPRYKLSRRRLRPENKHHALAVQFAKYPNPHAGADHA
jgi:hypothetical protein